MPKLNVFIFDCDGTVLNTLPDLAAATNRTLADMGYPTRTQEEIVTFIGEGARRLIDKALPGQVSEQEHARAFEHWCKVYVDMGFSLTQYYPGMQDALAGLKQRGCKLGVLSNKIDSATKMVIEQYYPGVFDLVYGERAGVPRKPDPQGLKSMITELGSEPAFTAYIGDATTDVQVAKRAGAYSVAVEWGYTSPAALKEQNPDLLISHADQLLALA